MQFAKRLREGISEGRITCTVRIWQRPQVKAGGIYAFGDGHIHVESIRPIALEDIAPGAGRFYVYRVYGLHWMLNVVTGKIGDAAAVLIRGVEGVSGPGRVAGALEIDASLYGKEASRASGLWFEPGEPNDGPTRINRTARIGVDYAGPVWAAKKLRFIRV